MINAETFVTGTGSPEADLTAANFRSIVENALSKIVAGAKFLAIISNSTPKLFSIAAG